MDMKSSVYNRLNGFQVRDGMEMINRILRDRSGISDVIMDVGSGSGNVTKLLGNSIPHNRILALDIDPNMVKFAKENHRDTDINFVVQDITQPWVKMDPKIIELEGCVDLIFSNYVLHWVKDMDATFQNLFKLLKPGGAFYFTIAAHRFEHRALKLDSAEVQRSKISKSLKRLGFHDVDFQLKEEHWEFDTPDDFQEMLLLFREYYFRFAISGSVDDQILSSELEDFVYKSSSVPAGQDLPEILDLEQRTVFYDVFFVRAEK